MALELELARGWIPRLILFDISIRSPPDGDRLLNGIFLGHHPIVREEAVLLPAEEFAAYRHPYLASQTICL